MSKNHFGMSKTGSRSRFPRTFSHLCAVGFQCEPKYILDTPADTVLSCCSVKKPRSETPSARSSSTIRCCMSGGTKPTRCTKPLCSTTASRSAPPRSLSKTSSTSPGASPGHRSSPGAASRLAGRGASFSPPPLPAAGAAGAEGAALVISGHVSKLSPSAGAGQRTGCRPRCAAASCGFGRRQIICSPPIFSGTTSRLGRMHQKMKLLLFSSSGMAGLELSTSKYFSLVQHSSTSTQPSSAEVG
mmetsp:Transcript_7270/g.17372  ORF Transcript_7270/g.17372 Transcript_7270/m.17372 type:complete len:244 (+) Transcript_7270:458-1189(+)